MPFDNETNRKRITRIVEALDLLEVSGKSNGATPQEYLAMITPILTKIDQLTAGLVQPVERSTDVPETPAVRPSTSRERRDITLWKEAQTAPLSDLMMAYTTITARLTDLVTDTKPTGEF